MPPIIEGPPGTDDAPRPLGRRLAWFAAIAVTSALAALAVAWGLEALLPK